jgi:DNA-binding NtrC family response regulator
MGTLRSHPGETLAGGTFITDEATGRPLLRHWRAIVLDGPSAGHEVTLGGVTAIVGSARGADLVLDDARVSRRHAELVPLEDGLRVVDLDSKNGTFVGTKRVKETFVSAGSALRFGRTRVRIEAADAPFEPDAEQKFGALRAKSAAMCAVFGLLQRAAAGDSAILIEGEAGTGKNALAREVHAQSRRRAGPLVIVDCSEIEPDLLASELFGHRRGAFSGARSDRVGALEAAARGTVVLEEIGALPAKLQPALLRALEQRRIVRVGEVQPRAIDVRVVCTSSRPLADEVTARRFRADVYQRLSVVRCRVPALRERKEDIAPLAKEILKEARASGRALALAADETRKLLEHSWPGNLRELRAVLTEAAAEGELPPLSKRPRTLWGDRGDNGAARSAARGLAVADLYGKPFSEARDLALARFERAYLEEGLARNGGNVSHFAKQAGVARGYVHRLMRRNDVRRGAS